MRRPSDIECFRSYNAVCGKLYKLLVQDGEGLCSTLASYFANFGDACVGVAQVTLLKLDLGRPYFVGFRGHLVVSRWKNNF